MYKMYKQIHDACIMSERQSSVRRTGPIIRTRRYLSTSGKGLSDFGRVTVKFIRSPQVVNNNKFRKYVPRRELYIKRFTKRQRPNTRICSRVTHLA